MPSPFIHRLTTLKGERPVKHLLGLSKVKSQRSKVKSQRSKVKGQQSKVSHIFPLSVFATKTITEKPKGKGGQNDRIGGQDHRIKQPARYCSTVSISSSGKATLNSSICPIVTALPMLVLLLIRHISL